MDSTTIKEPHAPPVDASRTHRRGRRPGLRNREEVLTGWGLMSPGILVLGLFFLLPIFFTTFLSFTDFSIVTDWKWIGLDNYRGVLASDLFWKSVRNTALFTVGSVVPSILLGLFMAILVNSDIGMKSVFRLALYIPVLTSLVASSMIWIWLYDPRTGLINFLLDSIGLSGANWLQDPRTALGALIVMNIWRSFGFCMIVYLGGLQGIPGELREAAAIDGAGWWATVRLIMIPMLSPITLFLVVTQTVSSFQAFEAIFVMTKGGPVSSTTTVVHQIYSNAFDFSRMGYSSAMAMFLFGILVVVSIANGLFFHRRDAA